MSDVIILRVFAPKSPLDDDFWEASDAPGVRRRLVEALHYELLGPSAEDEELFESPVTRYLTGLLAPFGTGVLPSEQDVCLGPGDGDEDAGGSESTPPMSQAMTPSSIGLSFLVSDDIDGVVVNATWGEYDRLKADGEVTAQPEAAGFEEDESPPAEEEADDGTPPKKTPRWKRRPANPDARRVDLAPDAGLKQIWLDDSKEIALEHLTRRIAGRYAVSIFLVNRRSDKRARPRRQEFTLLRRFAPPAGGRGRRPFHRCPSRREEAVPQRTRHTQRSSSSRACHGRPDTALRCFRT